MAKAQSGEKYENGGGGEKRKSGVSSMKARNGCSISGGAI